MLEQVSRLSAAGFAIHWLHPKSKKPIGRDWSEKPVFSPAELADTYAEGNNAGVRTGKWSEISGYFLHIIDVDVRKDDLADEAMARLSEMLPEMDKSRTPSVISGSGGASRHFYVLCEQPFPIRKFAHSPTFEMVWDEEKGRDVKKWDWELQLLGTGAQAVVPPSIHPISGKRYKWERKFNLDLLDFGIIESVPAEALARITGYNEPIETDPERLKPLGLTLDEMREHMKLLPMDEWCEDREGWYRLGMGIHHETGGSDEGFDLWCEFSRHSEKFDPRDSRNTWRSFRNKSDRPFRFASIISVANEVRFEREMLDLEDEFEDMGEDEGTPVALPAAIADLLGVETAPPRKISKAERNYNREKVHAALTEGDSAAPTWVKKMNRKHAIARVGAKTVVMDFLDDGRVEYGDATGLHVFYENDRKPNSEGKLEPISKIWARHTSRRSYPKGIVFLPNQEVKGAFNLWQGWSVDSDGTKSCQRLLDHLLEVVCSGNYDHYKYLLGWLAHMVQRPEEKPGVAIVIKGKKGTGKDTPFEYIGKLFRNHYATVANQEQMVGKFNHHLANVLLLHMQEGYWAGSKASEGPLKYLVTSPTVMIEPKGMNAFQVRSVLRIFISSNERWVVPASEDERRYFVLTISEKRRNDHAYFAALRAEMEGSGPAALLHYLLNYNLDGFNVRGVPDTAALGEQKIEGLKNVERWWFGVLQEGQISGAQMKDSVSNNLWVTHGISIEKGELRDNYSRWMRHRRYDGEEVGEADFTKRMKHMLPGLALTRPSGKGARPRAYSLPDLDVCRRSFEQMIGSEILWPEDQLAEVDGTEDDLA